MVEPFLLVEPLWDYRHWDLFAVGFQTFFFSMYWTVMEGYRGQSIGMMVMNP